MKNEVVLAKISKYGDEYNVTARREISQNLSPNEARVIIAVIVRAE